jgi:hypothetical protein
MNGNVEERKARGAAGEDDNGRIWQRWAQGDIGDHQSWSGIAKLPSFPEPSSSSSTGGELWIEKVPKFNKWC